VGGGGGCASRPVAVVPTSSPLVVAPRGPSSFSVLLPGGAGSIAHAFGRAVTGAVSGGNSAAQAAAVQAANAAALGAHRPLYRAIEDYITANVAQWEAMEKSGREFVVPRSQPEGTNAVCV
jgi:hypothetical protein